MKKEKVKSEMKIKNKDLEVMIGLYSKLVNADYSDYETALKITKDGFKVEELSKAFAKIKTAFVDKNKNEEGVFKATDADVISEFEVLLNTEQNIDPLNKISKKIINSISIKGIEAKLLNDYDLVED